MGAYSYCHECSNPMQPTTVAEIEDGEQLCPYCGHKHKPNRTIFDLIQAQQEQIDDLNLVVAMLRDDMRCRNR